VIAAEAAVLPGIKYTTEISTEAPSAKVQVSAGVESTQVAEIVYEVEVALLTLLAAPLLYSLKLLVELVLENAGPCVASEVEADLPRKMSAPSALILTLKVAVKVEVLKPSVDEFCGEPLVVIDLESKVISGPMFLMVIVLPSAEPVGVTVLPTEFSAVVSAASVFTAKVSAAKAASSMSSLTDRVLVVSLGTTQSMSEKVALISIAVVPTTDAEPTRVEPS